MKNFLRHFITAMVAVTLTSSIVSASAVDDAKNFFTSAEVKFSNNDYKGAITDYTKAIELNPKFAEAYNSRAAAKFSAGEKQGSLDDYTKSIGINPKSAETYSNRGNVKSEMGD